MYSNGTICLIKLLFKMGLFTVYTVSSTTAGLGHLEVGWNAHAVHKSPLR
jgi:hypothetical protein